MESTKIRNKKIKRIHISPYIVIIFSFLITILIGSILLSLPIAIKDNVESSYLDSLFISTSASCVTGLSVFPNISETYTLFGKIVLIFLMEVGGISIVTLASFVLLMLGKRFGIGPRFFLANLLNQNSLKGVIDLLKRIIIISLSIQFIFVIINYFILAKYYDSFLETLGVSIFHTASSFNNAGFDIFGSTSMINFNTDVLLNISTMVLIILGGLGFIVLAEILYLPFKRHLSIHTKIVLITTLVLILLPTVLFRISMNVSTLEALFTSVTARTAGFTTIDFSVAMKETPAYPIMLILMFIGASPCSTGGGIKTTTFFIVIATIVNIILGKKPQIYKRTIARESIVKAMLLVMISLTYIIILIILLKVFNRDIAYQDLAFEAFSAFGTVGVSMGITPSLSIGGRILIIITMFVGRLGPLSFIGFWSNNFMKNSSLNVQYVEEKIIIG